GKSVIRVLTATKRKGCAQETCRGATVQRSYYRFAKALCQHDLPSISFSYASSKTIPAAVNMPFLDTMSKWHPP
ncbi:hypothetical protein FRX31_031881, partial [Thalictrum thalictroides]